MAQIEHGDDAYRYDGKVTMNFSSNIFTHANLALLQGFLASRLGDIANYPEQEPRSLERKIAESEGISADCVAVTGGATEAIHLIALAFRHLTPVICTPTFSEYEFASRIHALHEPQFVNSPQPVGIKNALYWLCNPNNPTGKVTESGVIDSLTRQDKNITRQNKSITRQDNFLTRQDNFLTRQDKSTTRQDGSIVVVDQAYEDYTSEALTTDKEAIERGNVLLLHSLTKRYCIPGLRLGYVVGAQPLVCRIKSVRQPWSVNALALAAGDFLIGKRPFADTKALCDEAQWLRNKLESVGGVTVYPTQTNFMLCRLHHGTAHSLKEWLVDRHGILIRDAANFRGLDAQCFRIAAQTRRENEALVAAFKEFVGL